MSTYAEMLAKIEELQKQAEKQKKEEYNSVLKTIKKQIADYGFTAAELGLSSNAAPGKKSGRTALGKGASRAKSHPSRLKKSSQTAARRNASAGSKVAPKYRDEHGNTWTGRGKQPKWLVSALASGRSLQSLLIHPNP
ncbi:MAG: H-NS histone family protein [Betaproteobacteria bacterium]|nr:H-NS histone family protein [Betaproteobacteria bacterium]